MFIDIGMLTCQSRTICGNAVFDERFIDKFGSFGIRIVVTEN